MTSKPVIKVFSRPVCNYCTQAKELLSKAGFEYEEYLLGDSMKTLGENKYQVTPDQFFEMIGKTVRTVPQITWDDELIGGFTDLREKLLNEGLLKLVNLELREDNANAVADNMIMGMIQDLEDTNHKINDNHMKDFGFFVESLRSLVYKLGGLEHPMHPLVDSMMTLEKGSNGKTQARIHYKIPVEQNDIEFEGEPLDDTN